MARLTSPNASSSDHRAWSTSISLSSSLGVYLCNVSVVLKCSGVYVSQCTSKYIYWDSIKQIMYTQFIPTLQVYISILSMMRSLYTATTLASYIEERREGMKLNRYMGDTKEEIHAVEIKKVIRLLVLRGR